MRTRAQVLVGVGLVAAFALGEALGQTPGRWIIAALPEGEALRAAVEWGRLFLEACVLALALFAAAPSRWAHTLRIAFVAAATIGLYHAWRGYGDIPRDVGMLLADEQADQRRIAGQIRPWLGDQRMLLQICAAFFVFSALDWLGRKIGPIGGDAQH